MPIEIPKGQFIILPGVPQPIIPELFSFDTKLKSRRFGQQRTHDLIDVDSSVTIHRLLGELSDARGDSYQVLAEMQPLVRSGLVHVEQMRQTLYAFDGSFSRSRRVMGEILEMVLDVDREEGDKVLLYRDYWRIKPGNNIWHDPARKTKPIKLILPQNSSISMDDSWKDAMGLPKDNDAYFFVVRPKPNDPMPNLMVATWEIRYGSRNLALRIRPLSALLKNHYAILGLGKDAEILVEEAKDYQEVLADREIEESFRRDVFGSEVVSKYSKDRKNRFSVVAEAANQRGVSLTPRFASVLLRRDRADWDKIFEDWEKENRAIAEGGFNPGNITHLDLQFGLYRRETRAPYSQFQRLVDECLSFVYDQEDLPEVETRIELDDKERQEAIYQGLECLLLHDFLEEMHTIAKGYGNRLIVLENLTTGLWAVEPIRDILSKDIPVFPVRVSSSNGEITLFPPGLPKLITSERPIISFVDGTRSLYSLGSSPRSFGHFWNYIQGLFPGEEESYQLAQWNPGGKEMVFGGKRKEVVDSWGVDRPTIILTNYTMLSEKFPEWVKNLAKIEHKPAFFDDWLKAGDHKIEFTPKGLEIFTGRMLLIEEIKKIMERHFKGRGVTGRF